MNLEVWLSFCILEFLVCVSPGPAVVFITSTTLTRGTRAAMFGLVGILSSNTLYFALSATGVATLLLASEQLFTLLRMLGGLYLMYLGIRIILGARARNAPHAGSNMSGSALKGFLVQSANPKALAYFIALLPQFINPDAELIPQILILGITSIIIESSVMFCYMVLTSHGSRQVCNRGKGILEKLAGSFMIYAGGRLLFTEKLFSELSEIRQQALF